LKRDYYILKNGRLKRKDNTIYFENEENKKVIPVNDIESIMVYGEIDTNTKALNFLSQNQIMMHVFNYYGFYSGTFYPREKLNSGFLIIKQAENYIDNEKRVYIAREIIYSASYNILKNLKHYSMKHPELEEHIARIEVLRDKLIMAFDVPTIMGIEGNIRNIYYDAFTIITDNRFEFTERVKRPPNNPMNALISFGNSLMYTAVLGEIYNTQLNPTISYLHQPGERRFSLSLDIAELFKPIVVDRIIFKLINDGMVKEEDFLKELNYCYLNDTGRKTFLKEFDARMNSTINHKNLNKDVSYKTLIRLELYRLIKHLTGMEKYEGFKMWW
jgi:CRISPR-associated protein Cas1